MTQVELTSEATSAPSEEFNEFQRGISDGFQNNDGEGTKRKLYCFSCHRMEYHYSALKGRLYHHLLVGFTFGLAIIFGPYRCRCCGYKRLCRYDFLNPRYHLHRWKYSAKSSSGGSPRKKKNRRKSRNTVTTKVESLTQRTDQPSDFEPLALSVGEESRQGKKRKRKKLKSAPVIDSIGKGRRERIQAQQLESYTSVSQSLDYSIDGLMESFETEESRRARLADLERVRSEKDPFVGKKAKPRKKLKGKPKRRFAKKTRLTGPTIYCFHCKQENEHFHWLSGSTSYFFFFGITFGLIAIFGPMRCSVCNKQRLMRANWLHPLYFVRDLIAQGSRGYK